MMQNANKNSSAITQNGSTAAVDLKFDCVIRHEVTGEKIDNIAERRHCHAVKSTPALANGLHLVHFVAFGCNA
jgi:hypothetical protein